MRMEPLGDQAAMVYCDGERQAIALAAQVRHENPAWLIDVVQAYLSIAVYYDVAAIDFAQVADWLANECPGKPMDADSISGRSHVIPCCYSLGLDLDRIQKQTGLDRTAVIRLHSQTSFTVYAIGFCPGFPYLGYLPDQLAGVPRLESPRLKVEAGSVGLTGRQTGIYTETRPGGWNIVGRTPLQLVDVQDAYFPLRTGDKVRFEPIDESEYQRLLGERLV